MEKVIPRRRLVPIITDLLEYRPAANDTIAYTQRIVARYGDVCEASFTGIKNYFIHDPELIKEILTTLGPKMERTQLFRAFRKFLGNGLFTSDGAYHKQQRKLIKPAFYPQRIEAYAGIMAACARAEVNTWQDGQTIDVSQAMTRITLQVIMQAMFGTGLEPETMAAARKAISEAFEVMNTLVQNPFYLYCLDKNIRIPVIRKFYRLKAEIDKVIYGIIAGYREMTSGEPRTDLLSMLMEARNEDGEGMSDEQIRDEVLTVFLAGHETTTLALTWTLYLLARHPDVEAAMRREVQEVLGGRMPQAADYQQLPLTRNVLRESLRLYPPAWTFARRPTEDVTIRDYHFPKGSVLWTITYLLHHDRRYFHDPESFLPSRWDEPGIKEIPKYAYFPFGGGNRMCIGEGFAWMEGVLVLAVISSQCRLKLPQGFTTDVKTVFTLRPARDIMMTVERLAR